MTASLLPCGYSLMIFIKTFSALALKSISVLRRYWIFGSGLLISQASQKSVVVFHQIIFILRADVYADAMISAVFLARCSVFQVYET